MTSREMVYAAIEGKPLEHFPVAAPYVMLVHADHWTELTGLPALKYYEWLIADPEEHAKMYDVFDKQLPFDIFQPVQWMNGKDTSEFRENTEVIFNEGIPFYHNKKDDTYEKLIFDLHESNDGPVEMQTVFDKSDVKEKVTVETAGRMIEKGCIDYIRESARVIDDRRFILTGGILNTFYYCSWYVGLTNLFFMLHDEPEFIVYLSERLLEKNIERIRMLAAAGGDAIYIDDATATNDMISTAFFEKFSLPYLREEIKEIKRHGMKAIVIYFGGIADRVEQIISSGADAMIMEATMKGFVNDFESIGKQVNGRMCLFGNLNPYSEIEITKDDELYKLLSNQVKVGRKLCKYVVSAGSPLTPRTSVSRIRRYIDFAKEM